MNPPLRVLLISPQPYFAWRGSSIRVKFNVRALADLGCQVDLLTIPIGDDEPDTPARVIRVWNLFGSRSISIGPSALKLWFDLLLLIRGLGLIFRNRYDVILGTEEARFLAWLLARLARRKCVYEKHSDAAGYRKGLIRNLLLGAYLAVEKFTCRHADLVICTGPGLYRQALEIAPGAKVHDIFDIPSSLLEPRPDALAGARREMDPEGNRVLACYVGSFAVYQGIDVVFDAIPEVVRADGSVRFVIIGGSPSEIENRRNVLSAAGVAEESVQFLGLIPPDELPAWLAASDILMAPRKAGVNTPLKVLDYFKAGGAIVATDTPANRLILDESCAKLVVFSAEGFARGILDLAEDPSAREAIARQGRKRYEEKFNFKVFTRLLGEAYDDMLATD